MLLSMMLLSVSLSLDSLCAGFLYGVRSVQIPVKSKILMCLMSILLSGVSLLAGKSLAALLPPELSSIFGSAVLAAIGIWICAQALRSKDNTKKPAPAALVKQSKEYRFTLKSLGLTVQIVHNPLLGDIDQSRHIDLREAVLLGLALSADALGAGIGSGLMGMHSALLPMMRRLNEKMVSVASGLCMLLLAALRAGLS
jgi:putative sporulation protein YtaF